MELGKPDPHGYYVLVFERVILDKIKKDPRLIIEEIGDLVIIRTRSRSLALELLRKYRDYLTNY